MNKKLLLKKTKTIFVGAGIAFSILGLNLQQTQAQLTYNSLFTGDGIGGWTFANNADTRRILNIGVGTGTDYFKPFNYPLHIAGDNDGNVVFGYSNGSGPMMVRIDKNSTKAILFGNVGQEVRALTLDRNNSEYLYIAKYGGVGGAIERAVWKNTYTDASIGYYAGFNAGVSTANIKSNIAFIKNGDKVFMNGNNYTEAIVLGTVRGMIFDNHGNLFYADMDYSVIRKVSMIHQSLSFSVNSGGDITLLSVAGVKVGQLVSGLNIPSGSYVGAVNGNVVSLVDINGTAMELTLDLETEARISFITGVEDIAGAGYGGNTLQSTAATSTINLSDNAGTQKTIGMAFDNVGNLFFTERANLRVTKIQAASGVVSGSSPISIFFPVTTNVMGLACDNSGNLYIAERNTNRIQKVNSTASNPTTYIAGGVGRLLINFSVTNGSKIATTTADISGVLVGSRLRGGSANVISNSAIVEAVDVANKTITMNVAAIGTNSNFAIVVNSPDGYVTTGSGITTGYIDGPGGLLMMKNANNTFDLLFTENNGFNVRRLSNIQLLPVTLSQPFTAKLVVSGTISLDWSTASETNNSHFIIKRSTDGKTFSTLSTVSSKGSSGAKYQLTDFNPAGGVSYYELSQVDNDGKTEVLGVLTVNVSLQSSSVIIYPNPVKNSSFTVQVPEIDNKSDLTLSIVDLVGKVLYKNSYTKAASGIYNVKLSSELQKGIYVVKINGVYSRKITIE